MQRVWAAFWRLSRGIHGLDLSLPCYQKSDSRKYWELAHQQGTVLRMEEETDSEMRRRRYREVT